VHELNTSNPITQLSLGLRSSECESANATITITDQAGNQLANPTTTPINPNTTTDLTLTITPPTDQTLQNATITITTDGQGCTVDNFPYPQFLQVINPSTR
jgi:hypothetical protein